MPEKPEVASVAMRVPEVPPAIESNAYGVVVPIPREESVNLAISVLAEDITGIFPLLNTNLLPFNTPI